MDRVIGARASVQDLMLVLEAFFPPHTTLSHLFLLFATFITLLPLLRLHAHQYREPRQPYHTAWRNAILRILRATLQDQEDVPAEDDEPMEMAAQEIHADLDYILTLLDIPADDEPQPLSLFQEARRVLITTRVHCAFCDPLLVTGLPPSLRLDKELSYQVRFLGRDLRWMYGHLMVAQCVTCRARYYPDRITRRINHEPRSQQLEIDAPYLLVSKHGVWVDRKVAIMQETAVHRLSAGWASLTTFMNELTSGQQFALTTRQVITIKILILSDQWW